MKTHTKVEDGADMKAGARVEMEDDAMGFSSRKRKASCADF